jgi:hypothetical protein
MRDSAKAEQRSIRSTPHSRGGALLLIVAGLIGCKAQEDLLGSELASVETWAESGGARTTSVRSTSHAPSGLATETTWIVTTSRSCADYLAVLKERPPRGYRGCEPSDGGLSCTRQLPGDLLRVAVERVDAGPPCQLRVSVAASVF